MAKAYIILEWVGRWVISDGYHGGVKAGPYRSEERAENALLKYAKDAHDCVLEYRDQEAALEERDYVLKRHKIVSFELPEDLT